MRDVYLWTAYVVGSGAVGAVIAFVLSRLLDDRRERRYVPPAKLYTEVRPLPFRQVGDLGYAAAREADKPAPEEEFPQVVRWASDATAWALDALSDARKAAGEDDYATLGEFARAKPQPASIWCDMVGRRTVLGLVTA